MRTISDQLSDYVDHFELADVSDEALLRTKQFVLDTLGCVLYGFSSPSASLVRKFSMDSFAGEQSSIVGAERKSSCFGAALANGVALRQSEYLDYLAVPFSDFIQVAHPSETIPPILAVSEKERSSGRDFLLSVFIGYELSGRLCASVGSSSLSARGWHHSTLGYSIVPLAVGKLLGMDSVQLSNALGISACQATLGIIDAEGEEYDMVKNLAFPMSGLVGTVCAMLAKDGFTGSKRVMEGEKGFARSILREEIDLHGLLKDGTRPWVLETRFKPYPICGAAHGLADAAVSLAKKHHVHPSEVKGILARGNRRTVMHVGDPVKRYPTNKETADHSGPFIIAVAISQGDVKPRHFTERMYSNPTILELINKVKIETSRQFDDPKIYPAAQVEVRTKSGSVYIEESRYHKGHPENPMNEREIEDKFLEASSPVLGEDKARKLAQAVYGLDRFTDICEFAELLR
jgi:2-methylcitrate dehydratase